MKDKTPAGPAEISIEEVRHVAALARLYLLPEEERPLAVEMSRILDYVGHLQALDTQGIEAAFGVLPLNDVMRDDLVRPSLPVEQVLSNAPRQLEGHFLMPRIMGS